MEGESFLDVAFNFLPEQADPHRQDLFNKEIQTRMCAASLKLSRNFSRFDKNVALSVQQVCSLPLTLVDLDNASCTLICKLRNTHNATSVTQHGERTTDNVHGIL